MALMRETGCEVEAMVMQSDSEPVLTQVVEEVGRLRAAIRSQGMMVENSLVFWSKSNGFIEKTIQSVHGLVTIWRSSQEMEREHGRGAQDTAVACRDGRVDDVEGSTWEPTGRRGTRVARRGARGPLRWSSGMPSCGKNDKREDHSDKLWCDVGGRDLLGREGGLRVR